MRYIITFLNTDFLVVYTAGHAAACLLSAQACRSFLMQLYKALFQHNQSDTRAAQTGCRSQAISAVPLKKLGNTMKKLIQSLVIAGLMVSAGGLALAQADGMMGHGGSGHGDPAKMAQMHAKHLSELKAQLKITAPQEAAWTTYTESMKPPAEMMGKRPDHTEMDKLSAPERIDKMRALHKDRMAAMEATMDKQGEATKTFYAVLTPEQKKVFDGEFTKMGRRGDQEHTMGQKMGNKMDQDGVKPVPAAKP
jgi:periplasmic protein CpxP/Spy